MASASSQFLLRRSIAIAVSAASSSSRGMDCFAPTCFTFFHSRSSPSSSAKSRSAELDKHVDDLFRSVSLYTKQHRHFSSDFTTTHLNQAISLFHRLLQTRPSPSIVSFNKLLTSISRLKCHSHVVSLSRCLDLSPGIVQNVFTPSILINSFFHLNRLGFGLSILGKFFKLGLLPNTVTITTLIKGLCSHGHVCQALHIYPKIMDYVGCQPNMITCNTVINGLCKQGHTQSALTLLRKMEHNSTCMPNLVTYSTVIDGLCKDKMLDQALEGCISLHWFS